MKIEGAASALLGIVLAILLPGGVRAHRQALPRVNTAQALRPGSLPKLPDTLQSAVREAWRLCRSGVRGSADPVAVRIIFGATGHIVRADVFDLNAPPSEAVGDCLTRSLALLGSNTQRLPRAVFVLLPAPSGQRPLAQRLMLQPISARSAPEISNVPSHRGAATSPDT